MKHQNLTEDIIKIFYKVYNVLGYGFLEKIYENAMMIEFRNTGISAEAQSPIEVAYEGEIVGEHAADIIVDHKVIIELKAAKNIAKDHHAQLLNYLKATDIEVGLLLNLIAQLYFCKFNLGADRTPVSDIFYLSPILRWFPSGWR